MLQFNHQRLIPTSKEDHFMIKLIVGKKGTGKTKTIIDMANVAMSDEKNHVVVIEKSDKLRYDINHKARLVSASEYQIKGFDMFAGFMAGLFAGNYDITHLYVDSVNKITGETDAAKLEGFVEYLEKLEAANHIECVIAVSMEASELGEIAKKHILA